MESDKELSKSVSIESQLRLEASLALSNTIQLVGKEDPQNWRTLAKCLYTFITVGMATVVCFSSGIHSPATDIVAADYNASKLTSTLGATTYLIGFAFGPFVFAPLAESCGRNSSFYTTFFIFSLSNLGCTLAPNIGTFLIFRFFAGFFGSPNLSNAGGSLTDMWSPQSMSVPLACYTAASICAPVLGTIVASVVVQYAGWRWNYWIVMTAAVVLYIMAWALLPETYRPKLLQDKIAKFPPEKRPSISSEASTLVCGSTSSFDSFKRAFGTPFAQNLMRPWVMLCTEPILLTLSSYMAFMNGVLFLDFTAYPIIFTDIRGWTIAESGLSFLGIAIGMLTATLLSPFVDKLHARFVAKMGPIPEARLPHLILLAWLLPLGLFWFGWTALPPTHYIWSIISGLPFGFALVLLFLGINSYLTDCYGKYSTSALAANSLLPNLFGAGFAVFASDMFESLGTPWASSLLGFIALAMALFPPMLYVFGRRLRLVSKFHLSAVDV